MSLDKQNKNNWKDIEGLKSLYKVKVKVTMIVISKM
jgi:hypothetical protein